MGFYSKLPPHQRIQKNLNYTIFTERELDIIALISEGWGVKKSAIMLDISHRTVETHIKNVMQKIGCNSRDGIIQYIESSGVKSSFRSRYYEIVNASLYALFLRKLEAYIKDNRVYAEFEIIAQNESLANQILCDMKKAGFSHC